MRNSPAASHRVETCTRRRRNLRWLAVYALEITVGIFLIMTE